MGWRRRERDDDVVVVVVVVVKATAMEGKFDGQEFGGATKANANLDLVAMASSDANVVWL